MTAALVTLKNSSEVPGVAVAPIMLNLELLLSSSPVAFYELVDICRDREHVIFGNCGDRLRELSLLEGDGQPHSVVRDVVLSAVTGEDFNLTLGSPFAEVQA